MAEYENRVDESPDNNDFESAAALLRRLYKLRRYYGFVEETVKTGIYKISVPSAGMSNIFCYNTWGEGADTYDKDARVVVSVDFQNQVAFILPPELPRTPGRFKVVQNIDDSNPPTLDQDYVRFTQDLFLNVEGGDEPEPL